MMNIKPLSIFDIKIVFIFILKIKNGLIIFL